MSSQHAFALQVATALREINLRLEVWRGELAKTIEQDEKGAVIDDPYSRVWQQVCTAREALDRAIERAFELAEAT